MNEQTYQEILLSKISPNPLNPRKSFAGQKFDDLVSSIREKGVIEPILVRPIEDEQTKFQVVFGERRYRALSDVAEQNGGPDNITIPALVKKLSEDEAFELMIIENLQREDLTELEEAQSFKTYLDKKGDGALPDLAERTGINPSYIRRRLAVLGLPKRVLRAWETGPLHYGHLEQLLRIGSKKERGEFTADLLQRIKRDWDIPTVKDLKQNVDRMAPPLKWAKFDLEKAGCNSCHHNSDVQKKLFAMDELKKAHCLKPSCFKQKQHNHLMVHWKKTSYYKKHGINGFRFNEDAHHSEYEGFWSGGPYKECKSCEHFLTVLHPDGSTVRESACFNPECLKKKQLAPQKKNKGPQKQDHGGPRVPWHGEYFREKFYQKRFPEVMAAIPAAEPQASVYGPRLTLFGLVVHDHDIRELIGRQLGLVDEAAETHWWDYETEKLWLEICEMLPGQVDELIKTSTENMITRDTFTEKNRSRVAIHIGIDLKKEWLITAEYLQNKTIAEIFEIANKFGVFETDEAKTFLYEVLLKKHGKFKSCKKAELIRIFMESGIDLAGIVPDEILGEVFIDEQKPLS